MISTPHSEPFQCAFVLCEYVLPKTIHRLGNTMAVTAAAEYAHLCEADLEELGVELEAIRRDIEKSRR